MSRSPTHFRLRNRYHEIEGSLSKEEILKRIASGRYRGEEEISVPPYLEWHKLSAHPLFYDAFLKKLFDGEYKAPQGSEGTSAGKTGQGTRARDRSSEGSIGERATRQATAMDDPGGKGSLPGQAQAGKDESEVPESDAAGATRRLPELNEKDFGATIHQSAIDALFSDDSQPEAPATELAESPREIEPSAENANVELVKIDAPPEAPLETRTKLRNPLDIAMAGTTEEENEEFVKRKAQSRFRRRVLIWGGVALALVLLFKMGKTGNPPGPDSTGSVAASASGKPEISLSPATREIIAGSLAKDDRIRTLGLEGQDYVNHDDYLSYQEALEIYRDALSYNDTNVDLMGQVAETEARLLTYTDKTEPMIADIKRLIAKGRGLDPTNAQFYRIEALMALRQKKLDDAKRLIQDADEADPENPLTYLAMAEVRYQDGQSLSAREVLEDVQKALPGSVRVRYLLASIAYENKLLPQAKSLALDTLKLNPFHPGAYFILGQIAENLGDLNGARGFYETCGRLAPFDFRADSSDAYYRLGVLLGIKGNQTESKNSFLLAYYYGTTQQRAHLAEQLKGLDTSDKNLKQLAREAEYGKAYFLAQAGSFFRDRNYREAARFYRAASLLSHGDPTALVKLGDSLAEIASSYDDFRRVMLLYERAIEKAPNNSMGYIRLGLLETDQYHLERGYKLLQEAVALAPDNAEPYIALGKHFYKRQDYAAALDNFSEAYKRDRYNAEIAYYLGLMRLLIKKGATAAAMENFEEAYKLDPQNYDALVQWLKLKTLDRDKNFAILFLTNLINDDPQNAKLYWAMGEVYATDKEFRRAVLYYHRSLDIDNRDSEVRMSLAEALEAVGELDNAVDEYHLASQLDRKNSDGFFRAADLLFQMHKVKESEVELKSLVGITPNYPGAHAYLSKIYQVYKQKDKAVEEMKTEVTNNPQNSKFQLELAELYMEYEKFDDAVTTLTRITNLPPVKDAPEYLYDKIRAYLFLSRCYLSMNKAESALGAISLALSLDSGDPELHRQLGYVYYALQRDQEAIKELQYYLARTPAAQDAATVNSIIDQMQIDD